MIMQTIINFPPILEIPSELLATIKELNLRVKLLRNLSVLMIIFQYLISGLNQYRRSSPAHLLLNESQNYLEK